MPDKSLRDLLAELKALLQNDAITVDDRAQLQQLHTELETALQTPGKAATPNLQNDVRSAVERLEGTHPRLTGLLGRVLDALSDVGL